MVTKIINSFDSSFKKCSRYFAHENNFPASLNGGIITAVLAYRHTMKPLNVPPVILLRNVLRVNTEKLDINQSLLHIFSGNDVSTVHLTSQYKDTHTGILGSDTLYSSR